MNADAWAWSDQHGEACRVLQTETLWGETLCRVWLPSRGAIAYVRLVEAALHAGSPPFAPLRSLMSSPALFPFALEPVSPRLLAHNPRLEIYRQGLDEDMVALR